MHRVMESAFPRDTTRYTVESRSEEEVIQGIIDGALAAGLDSMAKLYGVETRGGKVRNTNSCVPVGYAMPK